MKIQHLNAPPASRSAMPGGKGVGGVAPLSAAALAAGKARQAAVHQIPTEERRRSQRVLLRVRAQIHVAVEGKTATFDVHTLNVNPQGALVVMQQSLTPGTRLVLEHKGTRERVACKVARPPRESTEGYQIPVEFDSPAPSFWRIAFPPADWRPEE